MSALSAWGGVVARNPWRVLVAAVALCLLLGAGMVLIEEETRSDKLWVPQNTAVMSHSELVTNMYGDELNFWSWIVLVGPAASEAVRITYGVLTPEAIGDMYAIDAVARSVVVEGENKVAQASYVSSCSRDGSDECIHLGVLQLWCGYEGFRSDVLEASEPQVALLSRVNSGRGCKGVELKNETYLGDVLFDEAGLIIGAGAARGTYIMSRPEKALELSDAYRVAMRDHQAAESARTHASLLYEYYDSYDREIARNSSQDLPLVGVAFVLTFALMAACHVDWRAERGKGMHRVGVSACAVASVLLSLVAAYGLSGMFGVTFTSLSQVVAFVLVGVGVDDSVVLMGHMRAAHHILPPAQNSPEGRLRHVMRHAGSSVTVTSLTNLLAFGLGSVSLIPAIRWFCFTAAIAIFCDYCMQLTFFVACMAIVERREENRRLAATAAVEITSAKVSGANGMAAEAAIGKGTKVESDEKDLDAARKQPSLFYRAVSMLLRTPTRVAVIVAFSAYLVYSSLAIETLEEGLPLYDLAPDDSFLKDFLLAEERLFPVAGGFYSGIYAVGIDMKQPVAQAALLASWYFLLDDPLVTRGNTRMDSWLSTTLELADALGNTVRCADALVNTTDGHALCEEIGGANASLVDPDYFYQLLGIVGVMQPPLLDEVSLDPVSGVTTKAKLPLVFAPTGNDAGMRVIVFRRMDSMRRILYDRYFSGRVPDAARGDVFVHSEFMVFWQTEAIMWKELIRNLILAAVGVAVAALLLLARPSAVLLAVVAIAIVDTCLFGLMAASNVRFNSVSVINLVMAVGLSVDYTIHILHAFVDTPGASNAVRTRKALHTIGHSVALGGFTTFVGILPLAGSRSTIFRTFFVMLSGTVAFGLAVALLLFPVLLSVVGPGHVASDLSDEHAAEGDEDRAKRATAAKKAAYAV